MFRRMRSSLYFFIFFFFNNVKEFHCEEILQRDAIFKTLRTQINDTEKCKRVLKETKLDIYEPCHVHYQLFEEHIRVMKGRSPGELLDSNTDPSRSYVRDNR